MSNEHNHQITNENERKTLIVIILTIVTMVAEIIFGYFTCSMALLADGLHMGTHAFALSLTYIAYVLIKKFSSSDLFPNGTNKIGTLAAYTSSLFLGITGIWIIIEAIQRLINPLTILFNDAILVAVIGFVVNIVSIIVMKEKNHSETEHEDYNFKAAYFHILADVLTSICAIAALVAGKYLHFMYLDPIAGILGGILIIKWAVDLLRKTVLVLIDMKQ